MKILDLRIERVRGLREVYLSPQGKNVVIWGPNGSGKSGVVDAIDFLLSGRISRLTGPGTGGIRLSKHGPHVDWQPEDARVRATVELRSGGDAIEIGRCIADPQSLECPDDCRGELQEIEVIAQQGQHLLTRRDILKYITAEAGTRASEIQELLDLSDVEAVRKAFVTARNKLQDECELAGREVEGDERRVCARVQQKEFNEPAILEIVNANRAALSGEAIATLRAELIRKGLGVAGATTTSPDVNVEILKRSIEHVGQTLEPDSLRVAAEQDRNLRRVVAEMKADPHLQHELAELDLTEMGVELLGDGTRCPLCDTAWPPGELRKHLEEKMAKGEQAREYQGQMESAARALATTVSNLGATVRDLVAAAKQLGVRDAEDELAAWEKSLADLGEVVSDAPGRYLERGYRAEDVGRLFAPERLGEVFGEIVGCATARYPGPTLEQTAWDTLTKLEENLEQLEAARSTYSDRKRASERGELLLKAFESARDGVLGRLYDEIKDRFVAFYKVLHEDEAEHFDAKLQPAGAALDLEVDFLGRGKYPPHALHSEGHQDSMGLCLFLALSERLSEGKIGIVVLDDVVMSVDDGHRKDICRLLRDGFPDRQFFITTHDRTWATQLRRDNVVESECMLEFLNWTIDEGPRISEMRELWERIEDALQAEDVPEAAFRLRRGSEQYFEMVCDALEAKVPYRSDHRWTLEHLLPPAMSRYRSLLRKAKDAAQSWRDDEAFGRFQEQDSIRAQIFERAQVEQWSINAEVHYNRLLNLSSEEFRKVVEAFHDLFGLCKCSQCGGLLKVTHDDHIEASVRCPCARVNWNLQARRGGP
jgi:energy-coupling factor transporter ATP-binding protein EcfA2/uncharacterized Zn finger protein (UPF0148 family)